MEGMEWNGNEWNEGMEWKWNGRMDSVENGMEWNGMEWNEWNGMECGGESSDPRTTGKLACMFNTVYTIRISMETNDVGRGDAW